MDNLWITFTAFQNSIDLYSNLVYYDIVVTEEQGTGRDITARGQIGKTWIYYVVNGYQRRRAYVVPTDPQSPRQLSKRAFWRNGGVWWANESQSFRDNYKTTVKNLSLAMTGRDLFMQDWTKGVYVTEVIKSIQRGNVPLVNGANDVTITAVEMAKSIVNINSYLTSDSAGANSRMGCIGGILTSSTNLRIFAVKEASATTPRGIYEVIEFY